MSHLLRALPRAFLLSACWLLAGCGENTPPAPRPPPKPAVSLAVPESNHLGTELPLAVTVTGCDSVTELSLYDVRFGEKYLKTVAYTGGSMGFALSQSEIPFATHGMAADLSLIARVKCDDGRTNDSNAVNARFFPVRRVIDAPDLPPFFLVDGLGDNATFIGCHPTAVGTTELVRINRNGEIAARNGNLPFGCSESATFTERNGPTGKRWLVQYGLGAVAFDESLNISAVINERIVQFTVAPDGDAIYFESGTNRIKRFSHAGGDNQNAIWEFATGGIINGAPVVNPAIGVVVPTFFSNEGEYAGAYSVQVLDYQTGLNTVAPVELYIIRWGLGDVPPVANVSLNADGTRLYVPITAELGFSGVAACSTARAGCTGANRPWQALGMRGTILATVAYANDAVVAALGATNNYLLNGATGASLNPEGKPISPTGALVTHYGQPGRTRDFYLLNGPAAGGAPLEVIGIDDPTTGEAFRYEILAGSLMVAVDDDGAPWLRVGQRLVQLLPLSEYRQARSQQ